MQDGIYGVPVTPVLWGIEAPESSDLHPNLAPASVRAFAQVKNMDIDRAVHFKSSSHLSVRAWVHIPTYICTYTTY